MLNIELEKYEMFSISDSAKEKIAGMIESATDKSYGVRIKATAISPHQVDYKIDLQKDEQGEPDDIIGNLAGFKVYMSSDSHSLLKDAIMDYVESGGAGEFKFHNLTMPSPDLKGPIPEKIQALLDEQVNPAVAAHGGHVSLIDYKDNTVYLELGGGCKGCGMVDVTLKQGVEVLLKEHVPEIKEVLDVTDHASGTNPYYQPSKK